MDDFYWQVQEKLPVKNRVTDPKEAMVLVKCAADGEPVDMKRVFDVMQSGNHSMKGYLELGVVGLQMKVDCENGALYALAFTREGCRRYLGENNRPCINCGVTTEYRCARCQDAFFCSRECQRQDWRDHRTLCRTTR